MLLALKLDKFADTWNAVCKKEDVMTANPLPYRPLERGFTLIELMVVVGKAMSPPPRLSSTPLR
jgi:hypothetical protein